jgi:hypothetical protein
MILFFPQMILCWAPGNQSMIHDHADAHCFVKVLDGNLREVNTIIPKKSQAGLYLKHFLCSSTKAFMLEEGTSLQGKGIYRMCICQPDCIECT